MLRTIRRPPTPRGPEFGSASRIQPSPKTGLFSEAVSARTFATFANRPHGRRCSWLGHQANEHVVDREHARWLDHHGRGAASSGRRSLSCTTSTAEHWSSAGASTQSQRSGGPRSFQSSGSQNDWSFLPRIGSPVTSYATELREGEHGTYDPAGIFEEAREATIRDLLFVLAYDSNVRGNLATMALAGIVDELELVRFAVTSQAEDANLEHLYYLAVRHLRRMAHRTQALVEFAATDRPRGCAAEEGRAISRVLTSADRIEAAVAELEQVNELLETLWNQRFQLYRAFRAIRTVRRNLAAVCTDVGGNGKP